MDKTLVMKFGGTSCWVCGCARLRGADHPRCETGLGARRRDLGDVWRDRPSPPIGFARRAGQAGFTPGDQSTLRQKHSPRLMRSLKMKHSANKQNQKLNFNSPLLVDLCNAIAVIGEATSRALDAVASLGERMSVRCWRR
ncbi:MAG: hypothetical protein U0V48_02225 [Anaerolineales bacterium]